MSDASTHDQAAGVPERSVADSPTGARSADDLIDDRTKQLLRHSQCVGGKAMRCPDCGHQYDHGRCFGGVVGGVSPVLCECVGPCNQSSNGNR